jgi:serine/threonine protein kinase
MSAEKPDRIDAAMCDYFERIDRGEPVDREEFLAGYSDIAEELRPCLEMNDSVTQWMGPATALLRGQDGDASSLVGQSLGQYRLLSHLSSGGMSQVYLGEHVVMRRRVAIKVLPAPLVKHASCLERFLREAQVIASLDHPNIVKAHHVDKDGPFYYLVMEYVDGQDLDELVHAQGSLGCEQAVDYIIQAAAGLAHAHQRSIIHRDVKPGNLIVDSHGAVRLLDLGLALLTADDDGSVTIAHRETLLGTCDYLAPEQARNSHSVDARADIYSLGCTLYFLLTGRPPFPEGSLTQRLLKHQLDEPSSPCEFRQDVPGDLERICRRMMAKRPEDRPQSAAEVIETLHRWQAGDAGPETVVGRSSDTIAAKVRNQATGVRSARPRSRRWAVAGLVLGGVVLTSLWIGWRWSSHEPPNERTSTEEIGPKEGSTQGQAGATVPSRGNRESEPTADSRMAVARLTVPPLPDPIQDGVERLWHVRGAVQELEEMDPGGALRRSFHKATLDSDGEQEVRIIVYRSPWWHVKHLSIEAEEARPDGVRVRVNYVLCPPSENRAAMGFSGADLQFAHKALVTEKDVKARVVVEKETADRSVRRFMVKQISEN